MSDYNYSLNYLDSILNKIDSQNQTSKRKFDDLVSHNYEEDKEAINSDCKNTDNNPVCDDVNSEDDKYLSESKAENEETGQWISYFDDKSCKPYYYNTLTKVTQWERPPLSELKKQISTNSGDSNANNDYVFHATFNAKSGAFSTGGNYTYWDKVGRSNDKEGRQLEAFLDTKILEKNREDYKKKKLELQQADIDWKKVKEEKMKVKKLKAKQWLLKDDDD
jgi:hypothetical protein